MPRDFDISDEEEVVEEVVEAPSSARRSAKGKEKAPIEEIEETQQDEDEAEELEEGGEEADGEDVYIIEAILDHMLSPEGEPRFKVKWEGYEDPDDQTWETEENLSENASDALQEYYRKVGGRDFVLDGGPKPKKRGRQSTGTASPQASTNGKRQKKETHPALMSPPASAKWSPPSGSWEEDVESIDAAEGRNGEVLVYLQWHNGRKTSNSLEQVYKRCPQKMLKFYEKHLVFKRGGGTAKEKAAGSE